MKICAIDNDLLARYEAAEEELKALAPYGEFINGRLEMSDDEKVALAEDCEVALFGTAYLSNEVVSRLPKLKILQFLGTGVANYVDVAFCEKRGIKVLNVEEYGSNAVAEFAVAMIFSALRRIPLSDARVKRHQWSYDEMEGLELAGSTVGIVGTGKIGGMVAEKLHALGAAEINAFDVLRNEGLIQRCGVRYTSLEDLFRRSDIVSIHLKYMKSTYRIVSGDLIRSMKPGAIFVNTARAELVDYEALGESLRSKRVRGAALDVYYEEPPSDWSICDHDSVISTSHIGFFTKNAKRNLIRNAVRSVIDNL